MSGGNALILEMGGLAPGADFDKVMETIARMHQTWQGWKERGLVADVHDYTVVTGSRTERSFLVVFDLSHEQLESLVTSRDWIDVQLECMGTFHNVATNRGLAMGRMFTLASQE